MKTGLTGMAAVMILAVSVVWAEPGDPAGTPAAPATTPAAATVAPPPPKPVERVAPPKPVERAAPVKPASEPVKPAKPVAQPVSEKGEAAPALPPTESTASACSDGLACWLIGFAMLVIGFAAGFITRHLVSRRQLGGMTVRIGTWRGIP